MANKKLKDGDRFTMIKVESSNVLAIGYRPSSKILRVQFKDKKDPKTGPYYRYWPISPDQFAELDKAESKGAWVNSNIRNNTDLEVIKEV